jgi:chemotaxis protein methyltransferase WspC
MGANSSALERLLASRAGLDPLSVGSALILRAARQRMKELGLDDMGAYEECARESNSELQSLIEEVMVSESWFFRDVGPFQWFRTYVQKRWVNELVRPPLRVLSLACASGEEPYSIAMTLQDIGLPTHRFQIDAIDISTRQLAIARRGVYSSNAFRSSDLSFRARYFREHSQGYELDSSIRSTVRFLHASVVDPNLLEGSAPYDVVFCRNLLIYLEASARVCVLATIERLLAVDGLLFIGHADRLDVPGVESRFSVVDDPSYFVYHLRGQGDLAVSRPIVQLDPRPPIVALSAPAIAPPSVIVFSPVAINGIITGTDEPPGAAIHSPPVDEPTLLEQAAELANQGRFDEGIAACERQLQLKGFSPAAYYLMGVIFQASGKRLRAEECFHKTVYLDPLHDEALLALALLAERRGDHDAAVSFRRRAERSVTMSTKRVR